MTIDGFDLARDVARRLRDLPVPDNTTLGYGAAGIALFLLRLAETFGEEQWLPDLDTLRALDAPAGGLYTGTAGIAYVLAEAYRVTGDDRCADRAVVLTERADVGEAEDLFGGAAGLGMTYLHLAAALGVPALADRAVALADRMTRPEANPLLNFAHGTAGVAYFLAATAEASGRDDLIEAALAAGTYLRGVGGGVLPVVANDAAPFWPGWCHGPAGTVRLWWLLSDLSGDPAWHECLDTAATALHRDPDLGNGTTRCCGTAGMAETLLDLYALTGDAVHLDAARRRMAHVERWATRDASGTYWEFGPNAPTGWLDGAAGIGHALLRWGAVERGATIAPAYADVPLGRLVLAVAR